MCLKNTFLADESKNVLYTVVSLISLYHTTSGLKQGCVLAPTLFNLFMANLSVLLNECNSHAPKLGGCQLSNLLYADDLVLISRTPICLLRLLDITSQYSETNRLSINQEKTKVMCVNFRKIKTKYKWCLAKHKLEEVQDYKYLGVIFDSRGNYTAQCEAIKKRGLMIAVALRNLKNKMSEPSFLPLIGVIQAKLISSITYGSEAMRGRDAGTLNGVIARALRMIYGLPGYTPPAQLRLEFGQQRQELARKGAFINTWYKIKLGQPETLNTYLWRELQASKTCPARHYLDTTLDQLGLRQLWDSSGTLASLKKLVNKVIKKESMIQDKADLSERAHGWLTIQSYSKASPQAYLQTNFSKTTKEKFLRFQVGLLPTAYHLPPWLRPQKPAICHLCGKSEEDIVHIITTCRKLIQERRTLLRPLFNKK